MATLNLGRIKPVFRGAYAGGTAYVVDDIVTSGNETFICILASTGNATSNATYWTKLAAKGTDGTNGTDVGTVITTEGDILYRDGSGLQRLAKPASDMYLKNTSAGTPSWAALSSDWVKIASGVNDSLSASSFNIEGIFSADYDIYKLFIWTKNENNWNKWRFLSGTNTVQSSSWYRSSGRYNKAQSGSNGTGDMNRWNEDHFYSHTYWTSAQTAGAAGEYTFFDPFASDKPSWVHWKGSEIDASWIYSVDQQGYYNDNMSLTGFHLYAAGGNIDKVHYWVYGMKP